MGLRITGGEWGGRPLQAPPGVRPAQDRVRLAVFSTLAGRVSGARVLDLFAGTGAYGLEALSRGAASAIWVENGRQVLPVLRRNVASLTGSEAGVEAVDVGRFLKRAGAARSFDLVFADPPYAEAAGWFRIILSAVAGRSILAPGAWLILEHAAREPLAPAAGWSCLKRRVYGETQIDYLAPAGAG